MNLILVCWVHVDSTCRSGKVVVFSVQGNLERVVVFNFTLDKLVIAEVFFCFHASRKLPLNFHQRRKNSQQHSAERVAQKLSGASRAIEMVRSGCLPTGPLHTTNPVFRAHSQIFTASHKFASCLLAKEADFGPGPAASETLEVDAKQTKTNSVTHTRRLTPPHRFPDLQHYTQVSL